MSDADQVTSRDAARGFAELAGSVRFSGRRVVVTNHGRPIVAVIPLADLQRLEQLEQQPAAASAPAPSSSGEAK